MDYQLITAENGKLKVIGLGDPDNTDFTDQFINALPEWKEEWRPELERYISMIKEYSSTTHLTMQPIGPILKMLKRSVENKSPA